MTKKGHENFWLIKKKLGEKVIGKIFHRLFVTCCSETGGRMLHRLGGWTLLPYSTMYQVLMRYWDCAPCPTFLLQRTPPYIAALSCPEVLIAYCALRHRSTPVIPVPHQDVIHSTVEHGASIPQSL